MDSSGKLVRVKALAAIHIRKDQLRLDDETYRSLLHSRYGVSSAKELTAEQRRDLLDYFKSFEAARSSSMCRLICAPAEKRLIPPGKVYAVSPGQLSTIKKIRDDIRWRARGGYEAWLWRYFRLKEIKTSIEAGQVIAGLKGLWRSQHGCKCGIAMKAKTRKEK
jgi:hypothetical protein